MTPQDQVSQRMSLMSFLTQRAQRYSQHSLLLWPRPGKCRVIRTVWKRDMRWGMCIWNCRGREHRHQPRSVWRDRMKVCCVPFRHLHRPLPVVPRRNQHRRKH